MCSQDSYTRKIRYSVALVSASDETWSILIKSESSASDVVADGTVTAAPN
jgi:hypothetical protein